MAFEKTPVTQLSDERLAREIAGGSAAAFEEFYTRFSKRLLLYFQRMLKDKERSRDFLQDLCITLIQKAHTFRSDGKFSTWIFTIASNMCKNDFRKRKRLTHQNHESLEKFAAEEKGVADQTETAFFIEDVNQALGQMTVEKRDAFLLRYQEGLSIKEISKIVNCPPGTVKSRLFHATRELSVKLSAYRRDGGSR